MPAVLVRGTPRVRRPYGRKPPGPSSIAADGCCAGEDERLRSEDLPQHTFRGDLDAEVESGGKKADKRESGEQLQFRVGRIWSDRRQRTGNRMPKVDGVADVAEKDERRGGQEPGCGAIPQGKGQDHE